MYVKRSAARMICPPRYIAVIPAAGSGTRMRGTVPKQYLELAGRPMLRYVLETFARTLAIEQIHLIVSPDDGWIDAMLADAPHLRERVTLQRVGGSSRHQSVLNGLQTLQSHLDDTDWILVHDAARPGLSVSLIERLIATVGDDAVGGLLALPVADTLKRAGHGRVEATLDRGGLWSAQTPQMFRFGLLRQALMQAPHCTDEASALEALGHQPILVEGSACNFKVTLPDDAVLATLMLKGIP